MAVLHAACGRMRVSTAASEASTATRSSMTLRTTVRLSVAAPSGAVAAPCHVLRQLAGRLVDQE